MEGMESMERTESMESTNMATRRLKLVGVTR